MSEHCKSFGFLSPPHWTVFVVAALMLSAMGCQSKPVQRPDRGSVSGVIRYKGSPVKGGRVAFTSSSNPNETAMCLLQEDGSYSVWDAPLGKIVVTVDTETTKPELGDRYVALPAKYAHENTSGLSLEVQLGENQKDFDLD